MSPVREQVTLTHRAYGDEWACTAGQALEPVGCERHAQHYRCDTCEGFYGVPHDSIHSGPDAHPTFRDVRMGCACRPCREARS